MNVRYRVELDQSEREQLTALLSGGKHAARKLKRAQILLAADSGVSDEAIARPASPSPGRRYTGPSGVLLKAIWKPRSARSRVRARRASSPAKEEALL